MIPHMNSRREITHNIFPVLISSFQQQFLFQSIYNSFLFYFIKGLRYTLWSLIHKPSEYIIELVFDEDSFKRNDFS